MNCMYVFLLLCCTSRAMPTTQQVHLPVHLHLASIPEAKEEEEEEGSALLTSHNRRPIHIEQAHEEDSDYCTMVDCCHYCAACGCYAVMVGTSKALWCLIQTFYC